MYLLQTIDSKDEEMITSQPIERQETDMITSENFDDLLGHLIWPLTVVIILLIFKKNLSHIFKRLGSLEATAQGLSMTFDNQIEEAESVVLFKPEPLSKKGVRVKSGAANVKSNSPHYQLLAIRADLRDLIIEKAQKFNIPTQNKSSLELRDELIDRGELTPDKAHAFSVLTNLTSSAGPEITNAQVNKIKFMYNHLSL